MVMGFLPRDVIEAMLAGHCVMFHAAMTACVPETLNGETDATRRGARSRVIALNRAFSGNLDRLAKYRAHPAEGNRDAVATRAEVRPAAKPAESRPVPKAVESVEPVAPLNRAATRVARKLAARALRRTGRTLAGEVSVPASREIPVSPRAVVEDPVSGWFSSADLAMMHDKPAAMAALAARDPVAFVHFHGITDPGAEFLAAAAEPGSPFAPDVGSRRRAVRIRTRRGTDAGTFARRLVLAFVTGIDAGAVPRLIHVTSTRMTGRRSASVALDRGSSVLCRRRCVTAASR